MAKRLIIGSASTQYKDKYTGDPKKMLTLYCVGNSIKAHGKLTEEIILNEDSPLYGMIANNFNEVTDIVGYMVDIDRDKRGYIENFELLGKSDDDIVWGF